VSSDSGTVFLTDGRRFIGPYLPGDIAISRGKRHLQDGHPGVDVYLIHAADLTAAKRAWAAR
jgi:hypothetical protein